MSRAFVKEEDNVALEQPRELELGDGPNLVTERGFAQIVGKVASLESELAGTTDEATRNRLARDLRYWSARRASAEIVSPPEGDQVAFGSRVTLSRNGRRQTLEIVGEDEADPAQGRINWRAPLVDAILGAKVGETVTWEDRDPPEEIEILKVEKI
jgi:transcription elongation factor GreB